METTVTLDARRITRTLTLILLALLACQTLIAIAHIVLHRKLSAFTVLFDMDLEANLPVFFNCGLFFLLALTCLLSARTEGPGSPTARGWRLLAYVFLFLAVDEGSQIHERFMLWSIRLITGGDMSKDLGLLHYAWVIPYAAAGILLLAVLIRFIVKLGASTRNGLIISGIIYVTGAVLMEMISGKIAAPLEGEAGQLALGAVPCEVYPVGECNLYISAPYVITYVFEEVLEMTGLIACIHVVIRHLQQEGRNITLAIPKERAQRAV